jgi:hypothetical protein
MRFPNDLPAVSYKQRFLCFSVATGFLTSQIVLRKARRQGWLGHPDQWGTARARNLTASFINATERPPAGGLFVLRYLINPQRQHSA